MQVASIIVPATYRKRLSPQFGVVSRSPNFRRGGGNLTPCDCVGANSRKALLAPSSCALVATVLPIACGNSQ